MNSLQEWSPIFPTECMLIHFNQGRERGMKYVEMVTPFIPRFPVWLNPNIMYTVHKTDHWPQSQQVVTTFRIQGQASLCCLHCYLSPVFPKKQLSSSVYKLLKDTKINIYKIGQTLYTTISIVISIQCLCHFYTNILKHVVEKPFLISREWTSYGRFTRVTSSPSCEWGGVTIWMDPLFISQ